MQNTQAPLNTPNSIAHSIPVLEALANTLDTAYWEANSISVKDTIYDCISALNQELRELGKLSIQDHDLNYEPISQEFKAVTGRFGEFHTYVRQHIVRHATHMSLESCITDTQALFTHN